MKLLLPAPLTALLPDALSPLEEGLRGPDAQALRERTQAQLRDLAQRAREGIAAGVLPERYRELAGLADACQAALDVIENWPAPAPGRTPAPPVNGSGFSLPHS